MDKVVVNAAVVAAAKADAADAVVVAAREQANSDSDFFSSLFVVSHKWLSPLVLFCISGAITRRLLNSSLLHVLN